MCLPVRRRHYSPTLSRLSSRARRRGPAALRVQSWQTPVETFYTNVVSQMNLFEAMRQLGSSARFLVIGSSEEYGLAEADELPIRETNPLRPLSPYAVSKVA